MERYENKFDYFTKITKQDKEKVKKWIKSQTCENAREKKFLERVNKAIEHIDYEFWIATIEPSVANGKIYYAKGENVGGGYSYNQWKKMASKYAHERGSRLAKLHELIMWYALRIAEGFWTLDYVVNDSSSAGNYRNAPEKNGNRENAGIRECGGYCDGQGNTYKIVTCKRSYVLAGGNYHENGGEYPVATFFYYSDPEDTPCDSSGVVVLTR